jgi:hypothetical protein
MKRSLKTIVAALAATLSFALPASAGAKIGEVVWQCDPDGSDPEQPVTFVSAPQEARHGIVTADAHAGATFNIRFGEVCTVEHPE